jgi:hypothetical protein
MNSELIYKPPNSPSTTTKNICIRLSTYGYPQTLRAAFKSHESDVRGIGARPLRSRIIMRSALIGVVLLNFVIALRCEAATLERPGIEVIDETVDFWRFWDVNVEKTDELKVQAFFDTVVAVHPELFSGSVLGGESLTNRSDDPAVRKRVATYLHDVVPLIPRMRILSNEIGNFRRYVQEFEHYFPGYIPSAPVYFTVSLFTFDAGARMANGGVALFLSIDGIAHLDGNDADFKIIMDHELFHQYHEQIAPKVPNYNEPLWSYLWEEGLATFVSQRLNPGSTAAQVLITPSNLPQLVHPMLPALARELLANMDSTDRDEFTAFFAVDNHRPDVPIRSGY